MISNTLSVRIKIIRMYMIVNKDGCVSASYDLFVMFFLG